MYAIYNLVFFLCEIKNKTDFSDLNYFCFLLFNLRSKLWRLDSAKQFKLSQLLINNNKLYCVNIKQTPSFECIE